MKLDHRTQVIDYLLWRVYRSYDPDDGSRLEHQWGTTEDPAIYEELKNGVTPEMLEVIIREWADLQLNHARRGPGLAPELFGQPR